MPDGNDQPVAQRDGLPDHVQVAVGNGVEWQGRRVLCLVSRFIPGSFDPVTNGHLDVVRQAVALCDRLVVCHRHPSRKSAVVFGGRAPRDASGSLRSGRGKGRLWPLRPSPTDDLVVTAAQRAGATILIRGLRDGTDLDYEMQMAG